MILPGLLVVPFLVEIELQENGGNYSKGADWQTYSVQDNNLITGQNPASSEAVAKVVTGEAPS